MAVFLRGRYSLATALVLALLSLGARAELRLELVGPLTAAEREASQALLDEALLALPPAFAQRLDRSVSVSWSGGLPEAVYGRASGDRLQLNRRLLARLSDGRAANEASDRAHRTLRRELLATVLHELTHLYDHARLWTAPEHALQARCRQQSRRLGQAGLSHDCRGQSDRRFTLSDDPRLLDLAGWPQQVGQRGARERDNGHVARSPDAYELASPREYVAVNMEYFLLDPSFACRRPALYRHLSEHFGWQPPSKPCETRLPVLNAGRDFASTPLANLDPRRVYEVDYLFADANQNMMSRWGHSMLRLVICAPERVEPGPDCRLDLQHHLVLSFRAFIDDVQLSSWDGLTGEYPSRLFVLPLDQVIDEYTKLELRGLSSVPLKLSREELQALVERSVELHWSYDGQYYFLTNNCAVETLKLLRAGIDRPALASLDSILPNGLLTLLIRRGLADDGPLQDADQARRLGYRFDSYRERYEAMFSVVKKRLAIDQSRVEDWLAQPAEARHRWMGQADLQAGAALLLLEQAARHRQLLLIRDELKQRYLSGRGTDDQRLARADEALQGILANSGYLSRPAELLEGEGYGIPQQAERARLETRSSERQARLQQLAQVLDEEARSLLSDARREELEQIDSNLAALGSHLRGLHRQRGGLQLP
ncbi:DUF7844 domain-containing protein [Stutzerimonas tarimensis]|uniref:DUF4105 domain-containing protein n=1 Tax=Stutzerimonas tarimensis TaxID=1507735 RepID=A0ABV7T555_9GAMM